MSSQGSPVSSMIGSPPSAPVVSSPRALDTPTPPSPSIPPGSRLTRSDSGELESSPNRSNSYSSQDTKYASPSLSSHLEKVVSPTRVVLDVNVAPRATALRQMDHTDSSSSEKCSNGTSLASALDSVAAPPHKVIDVRARRASHVRQSISELGDAPQAVHFEFTDIRYTVSTKKRRKRTEKEIIKRVSGFLESGKFLAILGASGAGKSSLLNILSGRIRSKSNGSAKVTGEILTNGTTLDASTFREISAYVLQKDLLFETLTPRETLVLSARLQLPRTMSDAEKVERADNILKALKLEKCANTLIGGTQINGISGGELKRVSIGTELVTNPGLMFVDEPTSGLDAFTAYSTVQLLVDLAKSGRTIVATIHQPSSDMFALFDSLCLLSEGEMVYLGPADEALAYFEGLGYPCPAFSNPADYFVTLMRVESDEDRERHRVFVDSFRDRYPKYRDDALASGDDNFEAITADKSRQEQGATFFHEVRLLTVRAVKNAFRSPMSGKIRLAQTVFLALLQGIIFFQIPTDERDIQSRAGALFFVIVNAMFSTLQSVILTFPVEAQLFFREKANGMYSTPAYLLSKMLAELPWNLVNIALFSVITYFMIGFGTSASQFAKFLLPMGLTALQTYMLALMVGVLAPSAEVATALAPAVALPAMLFAGFFIRIQSIQPWLRWISDIDFLRYTFEMIFVNEFENFEVDCENPPCALSNGQDILEFYEYQDVDYWLWFLISCGFLVGFALCALLILTYKGSSRGQLPLEKEKEDDDNAHAHPPKDASAVTPHDSSSSSLAIGSCDGKSNIEIYELTREHDKSKSNEDESSQDCSKSNEDEVAQNRSKSKSNEDESAKEQLQSKSSEDIGAQGHSPSSSSEREESKSTRSEPALPAEESHVALPAKERHEVLPAEECREALPATESPEVLPTAADGHRKLKALRRRSRRAIPDRNLAKPLAEATT